MKQDGTIEKFTKKEGLKISNAGEKLEKVLGGIKEMNHLPGLVVVVDARKERIAVAEAKRLNIPIICIIDTNADPDPIDFPIAANDDAIKSIRIIIRSLVDAAVEARNAMPLGNSDSEEPTNVTSPEPETEDKRAVNSQSNKLEER